MKFKLSAGIIVFFCCLYYIEAKPKRYNNHHCLASVYNLKQQLAFCHGRFVCDYYHGHPFQCIKKDSICDGTLDCPGGEDEFNCPKKVTKCQLHEVKCPNSDKCAITCNGVPECDYGVDEHNCKRKECGAPPALLLGKFSLLELGNSLKGARALLSCPEGYNVDGKPETECLGNMEKLSWTTDHGTCVLKGCGQVPNDVDNGIYELTSGSGVQGDVAILICNFGFCLFPESLSFVSITCLPGGTWSTPAAELYLCLSTRNLALGQTDVIQSTDFSSDRTADKAVDGIRNTFRLSPLFCTETQMNDPNPFWQVTFGSIVHVGTVTLTNHLNNNPNSPTPGTVAMRLNNIEIKAGIGTADTTCATFVGPADPAVVQYTFNCDTVIPANVLRISKNTVLDGILALCEVEVYTFQKRCNGLYTTVNETP